MAGLGAKSSAFAWEVLGNSALSLSFVPSPTGSGQRLTLDGSATHPSLFLTQLLALPPGHYVLSWSAGNEQLQPSDRILASLTCQGQTRSWLAPQLDRRTGRWSATFEVASGCPAQVLGFATASGSVNVWLEQISIDAAP